MAKKSLSMNEKRRKLYVSVFITAVSCGMLVSIITTNFLGELPVSLFSSTPVPHANISPVAEAASRGTVSIIGQNKDEKITGSGFIVSADGYIITCAHVVADRTIPYTIKTFDGTSYPVQIINSDTLHDVALLKATNAPNLKTLPLADSSKVTMGEPVIAIGDPFGMLSQTVTTGIVSGTQRDIVAQSPDSEYSQSMKDLIQIDAPLNPGESGGPVLNTSGHVIGITTASDTRAENISFVIPINNVKPLLAAYHLLSS